jgi:hypothetical protein
MRIIGFNFTKIDAEKFSNNLKGLKISTNIDISDIKEVNADFFKSKEDLIVIEFSYTINYSENIAKLYFKGNMILSLDPKEAKELLDKWKNKEISENLRLTIFNTILKKSTLKAISVEEELNLPPHIPLPSFKSRENKK